MTAAGRVRQARVDSVLDAASPKATCGGFVRGTQLLTEASIPFPGRHREVLESEVANIFPISSMEKTPARIAASLPKT